MGAFVNQTINTSVTPLAYLVAMQTAIYGLQIFFFSFTFSVQQLVLFQTGAFVGAPVWGVIAVLAGGTLIAGMMIKNAGLVSAGAFLMAMCWVFAVIAYSMSGYFAHAMIAFITVIEAGYFFIASSIKRLWNYSPSSVDEES